VSNTVTAKTVKLAQICLNMCAETSDNEVRSPSSVCVMGPVIN
jgi:hypothetical protein